MMKKSLSGIGGSETNLYLYTQREGEEEIIEVKEWSETKSTPLQYITFECIPER